MPLRNKYFDIKRTHRRIKVLMSTTPGVAETGEFIFSADWSFDAIQKYFDDNGVHIIAWKEISEEVPLL